MMTIPSLSLHVQDGKTALHYAIEHGYSTIVKVLLKEGQADVNATDPVSFNNFEEVVCNSIVLW